MSGWKEYRLGDIIQFGNGKERPKTEGSIPVFGGNGILGWCDKANYDSETIIIGRVGAYCGSVFYQSKPIWISDNALAAKPKAGFNTLFLYYYLKNLQLNSFAEGSSHPLVTQSLLNSIEVSITDDVYEQTAIAEVLSSLDDKIDLLHRQNKTLEQLAETLFRQWFVESNKGGSKLGDYVESANTGLDAIKRAPIVEYETGLKCLRIQDVSQGKTMDRWGNSKVEENNFKKFQLKRDDIIMARTCSPGINLFVREDLPAVFNNGLVRIRAKKDKVHPVLLNYLFKTRDFIGHIDGISGGTSVQLNMQVGDLLSYEFSFPPIEKQNEVIEQFMAFDTKMYFNQTQIRTLTQLRDTLLPKLMSGEVRVKM